MKLSQFFSAIFGWVRDNIGEVLKVIFDSVIKGYINSIWTITVDEVNKAGGFVDLTNEQKRLRAFSAIKDRVKASSIDTRDSMINLAIEMAVTYLKKLNR